MNENLKNKIIEAAESLDWKVTLKENYACFESFSVEGEDVIIEICKDSYTFDDILEEVENTYEDFDSDSHAVMWYMTHGSNGAPTDLRTLLNDAEVVKAMYENLYLCLYEILLDDKNDKKKRVNKLHEML